MPWIDIGRHTFDLNEVEVLIRGIEVGGVPDDPALTVALKSGREIDLIGQDARDFAEAFSEFRASRQINRTPPDPPPEVRPLVIVPEVEGPESGGMPCDPPSTAPDASRASSNGGPREGILPLAP